MDTAGARPFARATHPFTQPCGYLWRTGTLPLARRSAEPAGSALLVALHGMGMTADKFARVLRHLPPLQGGLLIPDGPYPYEMRSPGEIQIGRAWYVYRGDQEEFREHLLRSEAYLLDLLDAVAGRHPIDPKRTVLLGFSQGGYLAGFVACRHPERFAGLVIASARLKHEFLTLTSPGAKLPQTLFLHSESDDHVSAAHPRDGLSRLRGAGGDAEFFLHSGGHRLPAEALGALHQWLTRKGLDAPADQ